jgi:membrane protein
MTSPVARGREAVTDLRDRRPLVDHVARTLEHYSRVNGSGLAGAVTYFAFLSFFPILAIAFFVVGYIAKVNHSARDNLVSAITSVLPGIIGKPPDGIALRTIENAAGTVGLIGLVALLYSGLGWLSGMRSGLETVFEMPRGEQPNFVVGKLRDLATLATIGLSLGLSVGVTGAVTGFSDRLLDLVSLGHELTWLVKIVGSLIGIAVNTTLFFAMFTLLARPPTPRRALWGGALLGAFGFEVLKLASSYLLQATKHQPAFQIFGISLILLVWINYFSRVVMYAAAWAHTDPLARDARERESRPVSPDTLALRARVQAARDGVPASATALEHAPVRRGSGVARLDPRVAFGVGAAAMLGLVAVLRRRRD